MRFNTILVSIIAAFIISLNSVAFGYVLQGTVVDSLTGHALPGATIMVVHTKVGTSVDAGGNFRLSFQQIDSDTIKLEVHLIGYQEKTVVLPQMSDISNMVIELKPSLWKMDKVVVTATRRNYILKDVPITTELITSDEFKETGALTVDEALNSHIGADIYDDMSGRGITLRGVDPSRVMVLVDGDKMIGRVYGSIDLGQISLADVDRIEIVKGSGSTLYGSDAIGGVVNIITKKPSSINGLNLYSSYGSFNSYDFQAGLNSTLIGKGTSLTAKYEHTDGFDLDKSTEHTNGLENIDRFNINNKTLFALSPDIDLETSLGFMAEDKEWIESETIEIGVNRDTTYNYDDYERNYRYDAAFKIYWQIDPEADFNFGVHGSYYDHIWKKYSRSNAWVDTSDTDDDLYEANFQYNRTFAKWSIFTFGGDITSQGLRSNQLASGDEQVHYEDLYTQLEFRPVRKVAILPGVRWEHHETYGNHFNPSLNLMWDACSYFNLRGSVSRGFRAPSLKELYFEFDHIAAGYKVIGGGDDLDPETSWNYSLTGEINYSHKAMHRFSIFRNDISDMIEFGDGDFSDPTYWRGIYYYDNILKARITGFEWETEIKAFDKLDLSFSYTYLSAKNLSQHIDLINRPHHTFKFNTGYMVGLINTKVNFWGYWQDRKLWTSQADTPELASDEYAPSRWNLNLSLGREITTGIDLLFKIENLTNEIDTEYGYWPERSYNLSLTYNLNRSEK